MSEQSNDLITVADSMLKPGPTGRILRIVAGLFQGWFLFSVIPYYTFFMSDTIPGDPKYWVAVIIAFFLLNPVVEIGFSTRWKWRPQTIFIVLVAVTILFNFVAFGNIWGALLNSLIFLMAVYVHSHLGLAHILSGILGTPGCEMRSIPQLWAMLTKKQTEANTCPAFWSRFDHWENSLKKKSL